MALCGSFLVTNLSKKTFQGGGRKWHRRGKVNLSFSLSKDPGMPWRHHRTVGTMSKEEKARERLEALRPVRPHPTPLCCSGIDEMGGESQFTDLKSRLWV